MRRSLAIAGAVIAACAAVGTPLHAQGSSVDQHSACMTGRVGTGVASPCDDASAVYFGPAALAMQPSAVSAGVSLIHSSSTFRYHSFAAPPGTENEREPETIPVPSAFANFRVNPRLAVGIGVFAPYGLGLKWPVCDVETPTAQCTDENFEGRYTGYDNSIRNIYIQPTVAFQVVPDRFVVGAGLDYVRSTIEVHQRVDLPQLGLRGTDIADAALEGEGTGFTGHLGAMFRLTPRTWIAARYLHSLKVDMEGDATFAQISTGTPSVDALIAPSFGEGQRLSNRAISTEIELPSQLVVGISHMPVDRLNLMFDYQFTEWSNFDQFDIAFAETNDTTVLALGYEDTNTFRFGAEYGFNEALTLRAGFRYNNAASPRATPFLPEGERNYYTAGLGYRFTPALSLDFGYQFIHQPDREGAVRPNAPLAGVYGAKGQIFAFTLAYRFGGQ